MKKIIVLGMFLSSFMVNAQSYVGFLTDNYSGVHSVISNPANIVDSRFRADINLFGASVLLDNDVFSYKISDLSKFKDFDFKNSDNLSLNSDNNLLTNVDILGPSFMFNITPKHSIAFSTRVRGMVNLLGVNGNTIKDFSNGFNKDESVKINEGDLNSTISAWGEVGLSYATILLNKNQHFLKGGLTLKYLQGAGNTYASGKDIVIDYNATGNLATSSLKTNGEVTYGYTSNLEKGGKDFKVIDATGFGTDIGFIYEWRPNHDKYSYKDNKGNSFNYKDANKYKLKLGVSVTDIGSIDYKDSKSEIYNVNNKTITADAFNKAKGQKEQLALLDSNPTSGTPEKYNLPTAFHLNVDWNINSLFYVNVNTDFALSGENVNTNKISNAYTLTPRLESKWFSLYVPLGMYEYAGFQAGAGFRAGPLYVGSGSIITALASKSKAIDAYFGVKIPLYQSSPKDKDGDGVLDKADACPKTSGPAENGGCPWGDADGDGVLDNEDKCPKQEGPKENEGCPWGDKDSDGVLDNVDKCPDVAGLANFDGCPDTDGDGIQDSEDKCPKEAGEKAQGGCPVKDADGDGVLDTEDKCPKVPGVKENNGCPAITVEAKAKLDKFARAIYFNSGRTSFKPGVTGKLDLIVDIMKEYDSAKFNIEGHTDSAGRNTTNQRLSERRAKAVLDYLVRQGISSSRLTSVGYGEDYPIATNATRAGRAENRRVEIKLVK